MRANFDYRWKVVFLSVGIIVGNILYMGNLPVRVSGPLLVAEGLLLDGIGAVIALLPDVIGRRFEPTKKVNRIEEAQNQLFLEENLNSEDGYDGFEELAEVLAEERDLELPPDRIVAYSGGYGVSATVRLCYEKDEWSQEEYEGDEEYPRERYNSENIGPTGVLDSRVSQHIEDLRSSGHQKGFFAGLGLLFTGFVLQLGSTLLRNSDVFIEWMNLLLSVS